MHEQAGFRNSTIDHLGTINQLIEKHNKSFQPQLTKKQYLTVINYNSIVPRKISKLIKNIYCNNSTKEKYK